MEGDERAATLQRYGDDSDACGRPRSGACAGDRPRPRPRCSAWTRSWIARSSLRRPPGSRASTHPHWSHSQTASASTPLASGCASATWASTVSPSGRTTRPARSSTQRPQKIPGNVLSQADNLVLLRLNPLADAAFAQAAFSFVPPSLIEASVNFRKGEALIAGKISPHPALLRFGERISEEGGADVPATWAKHEASGTAITRSRGGRDKR